METLASAEYGTDLVTIQELLTGLKRENPVDGEETDTLRFTSSEFPAIHVRTYNHPLSTENKARPIEAIREDYTCYYAMGESAGFTVPRFLVVREDDRFWIIARKVEGVPLPEELVRNPTVAVQFDQATANQITQVASLRGKDEIFVEDAVGPHQFMWGKLFGTNDEPSMIFVDIDSSGNWLNKGHTLADTDHYLEHLTNIAQVIMQNKRELGIGLEKSQAELYRQLHLLSQSDPYLGITERFGLIKQAFAMNNEDLLEI